MKLESQVVTNPPFITSIFGSARWWPFLWLIGRVYLGYTWITAALPKLGNPAWMETGLALKGYWANAVKVTDPTHPAVAYDWYRSFLQALLDGGHYVWFAKLVAIGELLVGIALILGFFTGVTALIAGLMNWSYMMAGSSGVNPMLFLLAILLIIAWRTAGWWGLDRWLLPIVERVWKPKPN
jgi:thiosulfate dehydrogenase (quinone) large subunit